jgi:hypothetical protein
VKIARTCPLPPQGADITREILEYPAKPCSRGINNDRILKNFFGLPRRELRSLLAMTQRWKVKSDLSLRGMNEVSDEAIQEEFFIIFSQKSKNQIFSGNVSPQGEG